MIILNERPFDMTFEDYKIHLKEQKQWIKNHKKGQLYYLSSEVFYAPEDKFHLFGLRETFNPFVGKAKTDLTNPI